MAIRLGDKGLKLGSLSYDIGADTSGLARAEKEVLASNDRMGKSFSRLGNVIAAAISVEMARRLLLIADSMKLLDVRIKNATRANKEFSKVQAQLVKISKDAGVELESVVRLFEGIKISSQAMGATNDQVLQLTKSLNQLGFIGGSSAEAMSNAMRQLSQAMAGGVVRAEEFNSVIENAPLIAEALANGLETDLGGLRKMVIEGRLLSEDVLDSILGQSESIQKRFDEMPRSIGQAAQAAKTDFQQAVKDIDKELGATTFVVKIIDKLRSFIPGIGDELVAFIQRVKVLLPKAFALNAVAITEILKNLFEKATLRFKIMIAGWKQTMFELEAGFQNLPGIRFLFGLDDTPDLSNLRAVTNSIEEMKKRLEEISRINFQKNILDPKLKPIIDELEARLAEIDKELAAKKKAREDLEKPIVVGERKEKPLPTVDDVVVQAGQVSAIDKILADMGDEEQKILNSLRERNQKILESTKEGEDQRAELIRKSRQKAAQDQFMRDKEIQQTQLAAMGGFLDEMMTVLAAAGKEQSALGKAVFLASKAVKVAQIIANTMVAASEARILDPTGSTASLITATGFASAALVGGLAVGDTFSGGGRQSGGQVFAGAMHPITEDGGPEVLQQGSRQFLMPGKRGGRVVPAGDMEMGGGGQPNVTVINSGPAVEVENVSVSRNEVQIMIRRAQRETVDTIDGSLATGRGSTFKALRSGSNVARNI